MLQPGRRALHYILAMWVKEKTNVFLTIIQFNKLNKREFKHKREKMFLSRTILQVSQPDHVTVTYMQLLPLSACFHTKSCLTSGERRSTYELQVHLCSRVARPANSLGFTVRSMDLPCLSQFSCPVMVLPFFAQQKKFLVLKDLGTYNLSPFYDWNLTSKYVIGFFFAWFLWF